MKYLYLLLLLVIFIPVSQVAYGQNILDEIGQAFNNLTGGMMGGNQTNQSASSGGSANQSASSGGSANQSASSGGSANQSASSGGSANQSASSGGSANQSNAGVGSIQELQNLTSGNQELLTNNTSIAPENNSLGTGLEREQYVEPENQSNAMSAGSNSSQ
jgi:type IV secretory pathway TrbL component